ncbi:VanZ family protein [Patescibacteria group bacterium]|nr:VanZ family protein [Patescibacteria group bacterium]MCG2702374.1 VanZ family protein [Candidatus Parcubacteria bacterium]MBU4264855.1 VanZ family protein [Patescibacteria group bacterium]MBU4389726.1 VanZ family protein [Patescibacteria group bacterium]MBU4397421.1 VanZ family protein [Patescibacteria group bacterium]
MNGKTTNKPTHNPNLSLRRVRLWLEVKRGKIYYFIPSILWMLVIFFLSGRSSTGIGGSRTNRFLIHKTLHIIEYAILAITFYFAFFKTKIFPQVQKYTIFVSYLYALTDELHQHFIPGRDGKISDTFIDLLGILLGLYLVKSFLQKRQPS